MTTRKTEFEKKAEEIAGIIQTYGVTPATLHLVSLILETLFYTAEAAAFTQARLDITKDKDKLP